MEVRNLPDVGGRIGQRVDGGAYSGGCGHGIRSTSAHISGS
jgi:hypothetical protein